MKATISLLLLLMSILDHCHSFQLPRSLPRLEVEDRSRTASSRSSVYSSPPSSRRPTQLYQLKIDLSWLPFDLPRIKKKETQSPAPIEKREVVVIGAGVSGLICAKNLVAQGKDVLVVEAEDKVGGRVQTDEYKGFLLDRGFQVFIEAYPAVKRNLDYDNLKLQSFWPGALVRAEKGFHLVADPFRRPQDSIKGLQAPVGTLEDKLKVAAMRVSTIGRPLSIIWAEEERDTLSHLTNEYGLGPQIVERFFTPFYQGIYLAPLNEQSSRMFDFVFKMFADGGISLPNTGIRAIPQQLADKLPTGSLKTKAVVKSISDGRVDMEDGSIIEADAIVVATEEASALKLLGDRLKKEGKDYVPLGGRGSTCLYYAFDGNPPLTDPLLILNGEGTSAEKPVNNVVFLNAIAPSYAPLGKTLVSVTVVGVPAIPDLALDQAVRAHLCEWFGPEQIKGWTLLKIYRIPYAQPKQTPPTGPTFVKASDLGSGFFVAGDHRNTATLNGAFESGELAAEAVLAYLERKPVASQGQEEVPVELKEKEPKKLPEIGNQEILTTGMPKVSGGAMGDDSSRRGGPAVRERSASRGSKAGSGAAVMDRPSSSSPSKKPGKQPDVAAFQETPVKRKDAEIVSPPPPSAAAFSTAPAAAGATKASPSSIMSRFRRDEEEERRQRGRVPPKRIAATRQEAAVKEDVKIVPPPSSSAPADVAKTSSSSIMSRFRREEEEERRKRRGGVSKGSLNPMAAAVSEEKEGRIQTAQARGAVLSRFRREEEEERLRRKGGRNSRSASQTKAPFSSQSAAKEEEADTIKAVRPSRFRDDDERRRRISRPSNSKNDGYEDVVAKSLSPVAQTKDPAGKTSRFRVEEARTRQKPPSVVRLPKA